MRDTIDAAVFRGELDATWNKFLRDVAAEKRADELDLEVDEASLAAAAQVFRYEHELITTEETRAWLTSRGLTIQDFSDYFIRRHCADAIRENVVADEIEYHSAPAELRQLFFADLTLSGELEHMIIDLIWRLAARCAAAEPSSQAESVEKQTFLRPTELEHARLPNWVEKMGRDSKWFDEMLGMEAAYRRCCDTLLSDQARQRELTGSRLGLTQFEVELIEFESRDAAQEALLCVREDGMSMQQVAAEGHYPFRRTTFVLENIPLNTQGRFLGASPGMILDPIARGDGFELCRVINKIEPHADDPIVQSRIDQRLLARHFSELSSQYVQRRFGRSAPSVAK